MQNLTLSAKVTQDSPEQRPFKRKNRKIKRNEGTNATDNNGEAKIKRSQ